MVVAVVQLAAVLLAMAQFHLPIATEVLVIAVALQRQEVVVHLDRVAARPDRTETDVEQQHEPFISIVCSVFFA
jgi:hypothetical protein